MTSQLGRTLLASSSLSADEQRSSPDDDGTYDELTEIIDRAVLLSSDGETRSRGSQNRATVTRRLREFPPWVSH